MSLVNLLTNSEDEEGRGREIKGLAIGIVSDNQDPEGLARVKISFPWLGEESESDWVRVMSFMAGGERGGFFLPEVGDEVLVGFEHGDINAPYVLGGLWNREDPPPENNADGNNNLRVLRSRSGHAILFNDDSEGQQERLEITTCAGHKILLDDSAGGEKIEIRDKNGQNAIVIDSVQNSVSIEGATKLTIKATTIEIEAQATLSIKAGAILTLEGAMVNIN